MDVSYTVHNSVNIFWLEINIAVREAIITVSTLPSNKTTSALAVPNMNGVSQKSETRALPGAASMHSRILRKRFQFPGNQQRWEERTIKKTGCRANRNAHVYYSFGPASFF